MLRQALSNRGPKAAQLYKGQNARNLTSTSAKFSEKKDSEKTAENEPQNDVARKPDIFGTNPYGKTMEKQLRVKKEEVKSQFEAAQDWVRSKWEERASQPQSAETTEWYMII